SAMETQRQVIEVEPAPPSRLNAKVPRDLETICLTCLNKESRKRYATAAALGADLSRFLTGEPILARPTSLIERVGKWMPRHATATISGVAAVIVFDHAHRTRVDHWFTSQRAPRGESGPGRKCALPMGRRLAGGT